MYVINLFVIYSESLFQRKLLYRIFRNNTIKIKQKKKDEIIFVYFQWKSAASPSMLHGRFKFDVKKFFSSDLKLLNYIQEYCERNKIILKICLKFYGEKGNRELNYFRKY